MKTKSNKRKIHLLVCGSQNFDDRAFVYGMLNALFQNTENGITDLYTSNFSGACRYARDWIELTNTELSTEQKIMHHDCTFDMHIAKKNLSFYEEANLPDMIIQNDPFFQEGKELLIKSGVNMVCAFPNQEGIMGPSTKNIQRFSELGHIPFFNGVNAYGFVKEYRNEQVNKFKSAPASIDGLQNHHGMKR